VEEYASKIETESDGMAGKERAWRAGALGLVIAILFSCQSYEPRPLDLAAHREAWQSRTLSDGSLESFLDRLDRDLRDPAAEFDPRDGLTLSEGRLVALVFNPGLRLARLRVGRAAASAEHAGLWADPQLSLSVLRVTEGVPDPWVIAPSLTFSIPLSGRLSAERGLADAEHRAAEYRALEAEWTVWREVRAAWVDWSAARLRSEETERLVDAVNALVLTTSQLAESGEIPRTEATLFLVEKAQRENQLRRLRGDVAAAEQVLRALLGLAPEAPVTFVPSIDIANPNLAAEEITERNPSLARLREEYEVAEETLRHEIAKQIPDLTLGPQLESDQGQSRIGFIGAIPIPFLNANRQAIAEARVAREIARAAFETAYEILVGRQAVTAARARALADQRADLEGVLAPQVDRQLEDSLQLLRLGESTSLVLLESLTRAHHTKLELIETRSAEALARAELEYLTGPPTPRQSTDPLEVNP
jgi:outer membrane protein, heavy metal efflux system